MTAALQHPAMQRARGEGRVDTQLVGDRTMLQTLYQDGCAKIRLPNTHDCGLQAVLINTAGGLTGGDSVNWSANAAPGTAVVLTTQACERIYRSTGADAHVTTRLAAGPGARLDWLPQETILYRGCDLDRKLTLDLAPGGRALLVEPVIFGRAAMGERLDAARFHDRIEITRSGAPLYLDAIRLSGDVAAHLARPAVADGAGAMASVILAAPEAEAHLAAIRALLPETGGASLLAPDLLVMRLLAEDGFALRQTLLPVLDLLTGRTLPASWRL